MFNSQLNVMLYVTDVAAEKAFWEAIGAVITGEQETGGYPSFDMKVTADSSLTFTVLSKAFVEAFSPEVAEHQPSVLFQATDLEDLYAKIKDHAPACNDIVSLPFKHFNFASPSGQYYAVQEAQISTT